MSNTQPNLCLVSSPRFYGIILSLLLLITTIRFCRNEERQVQFLQAGDPAHKVLVEHLRSKAFMDQLSLCTHGVHTGRLEVLHSMFLAYVSKRVDYDPSSYNARIQLAVMDHNENCSRRPVLGEK